MRYKILFLTLSLLAIVTLRVQSQSIATDTVSFTKNREAPKPLSDHHYLFGNETSPSDSVKTDSIKEVQLTVEEENESRSLPDSLLKKKINVRKEN